MGEIPGKTPVSLYGMVRRGVVRHGEVGRGAEWHVVVWLGKKMRRWQAGTFESSRHIWPVRAYGMARLGRLWRGQVGLGRVRHGTIG